MTYGQAKITDTCPAQPGDVFLVSAVHLSRPSLPLFALRLALKMLPSLQLVERAEEATHAQEDDLDEPDLGRLVVIRRSGQDGGSDPNECDIVIKLPDVSKVWLHNLTKTNPQGTLVNGAPVEINGKRLLQSGDVIAINERKFRFESPPPP
ncbi:hypothetical protein EMIHUDRAFT_253628, partial [Emiliania huxleyi CCMP1516]|uniref:FHA domain-containing protein n=2 Tax=Emiliania huxleyi TaxID=2903 RepID=A0A0D3K515_EMIH1